MYFEPSRKTYYRFPSTHSVSDMDSRLYFPEKPSLAEDEIRYQSKEAGHVPERETYTNIL